MGLVKNEHNVVEHESISYWTYESYTDDDFDDGYISTNSLEDIWYGKYVHTDINARYDRLKICDCIIKTKSKCKGLEI